MKRKTFYKSFILVILLFFGVISLLDITVKADYNPIFDNPLNHLVSGTTVSDTMSGGKAQFIISNINFTTQTGAPSVDEVYMYIPTTVLTNSITINYYYGDGTTLIASQTFVNGDGSSYIGKIGEYTNMRYVNDVPTGTKIARLYYTTTETSFTYAYSMEKDWFLTNAFMKNQDYIDTLSYNQVYLDGRNSAISNYQEILADAHENGFYRYIDPDTGLPFVGSDSYDYTVGYNKANSLVTAEMLARIEAVFLYGIATQTDPDTSLPYVTNNSYDYITAYNTASIVIPQDIYDNGIEIYPGYNAMQSHDFIAGVAMDDSYAYDQGYLDGGNDSFMANLETWIVPAIIIVLIGGGFIAFAKMRNSKE